MSLLPRLVARSAAVRATNLLPLAATRQPIVAQRVRYVSGYGTNDAGGNESGMPPLKGFEKKADRSSSSSSSPSSSSSSIDRDLPASEPVQQQSSIKEHKYESSASEPLSSQMAGMKEDLKVAGSEMLEGMKSTFNTFKDKVNRKLDENMEEGRRSVNRTAKKIDEATADKPRRFHSSAAPRLQQGDLTSSIKKAGRKIKSAMDDVIGATPAAPGSEVMKKEAQWSDSSAVRDAANSQTLSTGARQRGVSSRDTPAGTVEPITEPVQSAMWDGPQSMPQGVGKRARDAEGRPMETGGPRT